MSGITDAKVPKRRMIKSYAVVKVKKWEADVSSDDILAGGWLHGGTTRIDVTDSGGVTVFV